MPKLTIYVTDELKARMDQAKWLNWSKIAQAAFDREIKQLEAHKWLGPKLGFARPQRGRRREHTSQ
jgi:post-segregation antitoxin (ccd killing protein)